MTAQPNTMSAYAEIANSTKIVDHAELNDHMMRLMKEKLSPQQQRVAMQRAAAAQPRWSGIFNEIADPNSGTRALFTEKNQDGTVGMYKDTLNGTSYISAAFLVAAAAIETLRMPDLTHAPSVGLHAEVCVEAFKRCKNHAETVRSTPSIKPAY